MFEDRSECLGLCKAQEHVFRFSMVFETTKTVLLVLWELLGTENLHTSNTRVKGVSLMSYDRYHEGD